jgi:hypothetical protein
VCVFTNSLASRLAPVEYARQFNKAIQTQCEKLGIELDPDFRVPILFYSKDEKHLGYYTQDDYIADCNTAQQEFYLESPRLSKNSLYTYLYGFPDDQLKIELLNKVNKVPLLLQILRDGYSQIALTCLDRLLSDEAQAIFSNMLKLF